MTALLIWHEHCTLDVWERVSCKFHSQAHLTFYLSDGIWGSLTSLALVSSSVETWTVLLPGGGVGTEGCETSGS